MTGLLVKVLVVACCVIGAWLIAPPVQSLDDAYIALHSAHTLLDGKDPVYEEPALMGATSPPHVALLAGVLALGVPDLAAMRAIVALSIMSFVAALWMLARACDLTGWARIGFMVIGLCGSDVYLRLSNGLETGFAIAAIVFAVAAAIAHRMTIVAAIAGLLPWLRPDLALIALGLWGYALWMQPTAWRRLVAVPVLVSLPWAAWIYADTGRLLPNTIAAKRIFYAQDCWPLLQRTHVALGAFGRWLTLVLPVTIVGAWSVTRPLGRVLAVAAVVTLAGYTVALPAGVQYNGYRYLYPVFLPLMLYGAAQVAKMDARGLLMAIAVLSLSFVPAYYRVEMGLREYATGLVDLEQWMDQDLPLDARIAAHDAGLVALTNRRVVDLVGLKTPASVEAHAAITSPSCGADRPAAFREILRRNPAGYLLVASDWDEAYGISAALRPTDLLYQGPRYRVYKLSDAGTR